MPPPLTSKEGRFLEYLKGSPVPDDADSSNSTRERVQQEERELGELLIKRKQEGTSISDADAARAEQLLGQWSSRQKMAQSRKRKRDREVRVQDGIVARMEQGTGAEVFELDWDALAEMEGFEECGIRSAEDLASITLQLLKGMTADGPGELQFAEIFNYHEQKTGGREFAGAKLDLSNPTTGEGMRQQVQFANQDYPEQVDRLTEYGFCNPWRDKGTGGGGLEGGSCVRDKTHVGMRGKVGAEGKREGRDLRSSKVGEEEVDGERKGYGGKVCGEGKREGRALRSSKVGEEEVDGERKAGPTRTSEGSREGNGSKQNGSSSSGQASQRRKLPKPETHTTRKELVARVYLFFSLLVSLVAGDDYEAREVSLLKSLPGCPRQSGHTDFDHSVYCQPGYKERPFFSLLVPAIDPARLILWPGSHRAAAGVEGCNVQCGKKGQATRVSHLQKLAGLAPGEVIEPKELVMDCCQACAFLGHVVHAGADNTHWGVTHYRWHCYVMPKKGAKKDDNDANPLPVALAASAGTACGGGGGGSDIREAFYFPVKSQRFVTECKA
eukprot:CAMPEP_0173468980 /NCGR_PEP_ID=MMETSP1357-20121228/77122_1 /TAXON_ID=77926 /ORGANISM="Hemiselmis rufescens, Strain PCC563" /LENGTH=554 /DNA_ID=CAMNT_0014437207 /DNA_START=1590 /DNA_END=3256 /DNA_ORIENTATION=+